MALVRRRSKIDSGIDMTPLIDVVFQLLIFLMISSQFKKPESQVDLPLSKKSEVGSAVDSDKLSIGILSDNQIKINGETVARDQFLNTVSALLSDNNELSTEIRGDKTSQFGLFVELMEELKEAGTSKISIIKQVKQTQGE